MTIEWHSFLQQTEADQARFLLDVATAAWELPIQPEDMRQEVRGYLTLGYEVLDGDFEKLPRLLVFLQDPELEHCFAELTDRVRHDDTATAALDLASYACGFVSRVAANASGYGPLQDPVLESLPDIYEYYEERAQFLGV